MAIRLSGLSSGLDTENIIKELVNAKSTQKDNLVKSQKKLSWKQDTWKSLNTKIYSFYSKYLSDMRLQSDYSKKITTSSHSAVSVITGADAPNSVQTLHINKTAKAAYLTGEKLSDTSGTYTGDTKVKEKLGIENDGKFTITVNGESKDITIGDSTTIDSIVKSLREAGVSVNFDEKNQRFYIGSKSTGKDSDFSLTATDANGIAAMDKLGIAYSLSDTDKKFYSDYTDKLVYNSGVLDRSASVANLSNYIDSAKQKKIANIEDKIKSLSEQLTKATDDYNARFQSDTNAILDEATGEPTLDVTKIQAAMDELGTDYDSMDEETKAKYDAYRVQELFAKEIQSVATQIETEKQNFVDYDGGNKALKDDVIGLIEDDVIAYAQNAQSILDYYTTNVASTKATKVIGEDAAISLNNEIYESTNNTFEINGITITLNSVTSDDITLTTADDTNGIYDKIKKFFKEYNSLINEMDKLYNAASASNYDMLTNDDKENMLDDEIKEWETKIKDSLLRRDSTLGTVSDAMKQIMLSGVTMKDGSEMYLSKFGINTLGYFNSTENEKNAYHIDGDSDDTSTSSKTDVLKAAIANDPDKVAEFFSTLSKTLYKKLDDLMASTDYSSAFTVYNDKLMKTEYDDYKSKISTQEDKISNFEDFYYKKFAAMEKAMAKLNSQQSSLSSLFGSQ